MRYADLNEERRKPNKSPAELERQMGELRVYYSKVVGLLNKSEIRAEALAAALRPFADMTHEQNGKHKIIEHDLCKSALAAIEEYELDKQINR